MCESIFQKQHDNRHKNAAPDPGNKRFDFFNVNFHFFSFKSAIIGALTAITDRTWCNSDANCKGGQTEAFNVFMVPFP